MGVANPPYIPLFGNGAPAFAAAEGRIYYDIVASYKAYIRNGGAWNAVATGGVPALTDTHIFVGDATNTATDVAMSGDAGISNTGVVTLTNSAGTRTNLGLGTANNVAFNTLALGGAVLTTEKLGVTGDVNVSGAVVAGSAVAGRYFETFGGSLPTNGLGLPIANAVSIYTNGTEGVRVNNITGISLNLPVNLVSQNTTNAATITNNNANGFQLTNGAPSATVPTLIPRRASTTTGIGSQASGNMDLIAGGTDIARVTNTGLRMQNGALGTKAFTVATLPAGTQGDRAHVTDANGPVFLAAVVGGGAVVCPVFYNGAAWVVG